MFGDDAGELANLGMDLLFPAALATIVMGVIGSLGADGLKTLVAWQLVVSVGTLLAAIALGKAEGTSAALFYLLNTTWLAGGLFLLADLIANQRGTAADKIVTAPRMHSRTLLSILFLVGATGVAGLPPLSGFFSKLLILKAVEPGAQMAWLWSTILVGGFLTLVAFSRAGSIVFWRNVEGHVSNPGKLTLPVSVSASALIAMTVVIVVLAGPISRYTDATAAQLHNPDGYITILGTQPVGKASSKELLP